MGVRTQKEAEDMVYSSYLRAAPFIAGRPDEQVRKPELTRRLLDAVGSPDAGQRYILVTGSKGKGSTSRFVSSLLSHMGYKVGLFTSPHLFHFNERIRIDGAAIPETDFVRICGKLKPWVDLIGKDLSPQEYLGPIGIALTAAALYFKERGTDYNVIECGRGGTYDDVNVLQNDWAVLTPIMEEHVRQLGPALSDIAAHKLGIVKECTRKIYIGKQREEVREQIKKSLAGREAFYYGEQFFAYDIAVSALGTSFGVRTARSGYPDLIMPMLGEYQAVNASAAIQLCEDIAGRPLDTGVVRGCFARVQWPGRCEIVGTRPVIILDGAVHRESAQYLIEIVNKLNPRGYKKITSIVGVPKDKDYRGVIEVLSEVSDAILITRPDISHLAFPEDALDVAKTLKAESSEFELLKDALDYALAAGTEGIVLIVGTQTLIGNAKRLLGQSLFDIGK